MLITRRGLRMFSNYDLRANLESRVVRLRNQIESDRSILEPSYNESEYVPEMVKRNKVSPLILHIDKITVSQAEANIPGRYFPSNYFVEPNQTYIKPIIVFHLPIEGATELLQSRPSTHLLWSEEIAVENNRIIFELINFSNDAASLQKDRDQFLQNLQQQISYINKDVNAYNSSLETIIKESVTKGREKLKIQEDILKKLGNLQK